MRMRMRIASPLVFPPPAGVGGARNRQRRHGSPRRPKPTTRRSTPSSKQPPSQTLFNDWLAERRQRRQYATARACQEALKKLSAYPPAVQETALRDSIANGWQGIFPDRTRPGGGAGPPKPIQHLAPTEAHKKALAEHLAKPQRF